MAFRLRPYPLSGVALAFVLALVIAAQSWGDRPQETPGVPPGTALPGSAKAPADAGPPTWRANAILQGVVAVSHPRAAEAGARMLENGGNAIDAAAAVQFVLNVVEPQFSGIGGGGFMMIHLAKTNETFAREAREKAPAAATAGMFAGLDLTQAAAGGNPVGGPGARLGAGTAP